MTATDFVVILIVLLEERDTIRKLLTECLLNYNPIGRIRARVCLLPGQNGKKENVFILIAK